MAVFNQRLGDLKTARELLENALAMRLKLLGETHPDVAVSLSNLASVYSDLRQPERAEPLFLQALRIRERALGPSSPEVIQSLENLGTLYEGWGRAEEAKRYRARAAETRRLAEKKAAF